MVYLQLLYVLYIDFLRKDVPIKELPTFTEFAVRLLQQLQTDDLIKEYSLIGIRDDLFRDNT